MDEQNGSKVHTDMEQWTEIRKKVLVEGASKRSIYRDYGIGHQALAKILANPEPPGHQMAESRKQPVLGPYLGVIDEILTCRVRLFDERRDLRPCQVPRRPVRPPV